MRRLISVLGLIALWPMAAAWAQLAPPNAAGVSLGQWHTAGAERGGEQVILDHAGGHADQDRRNGRDEIPRGFHLSEEGLSRTRRKLWSDSQPRRISGPGHTSRPLTEVEGGGRDHGIRGAWRWVGLEAARIGYVYSPDDLRIRLNSDKSVTTSVANPLMMFWVTKAAVPEVEAWYVKTFGGKLGGTKILNGVSIAGIPGGRLNVVSSADNPISLKPAAVGLVHGAVPDAAFVATLAKPGLMQPSKGRTLDYIGFEVNNLEAFCKNLAANGVKFDQPYSTKRHKSFSSAMLTDPWGTSIELTERLEEVLNGFPERSRNKREADPGASA